MEKNNGTDLFNLYEFTMEGYKLSHEDINLFSSAYKDLEKVNYDKLSIEETTTLLDDIESKYHLGSNPNILNDIIEYKELNSVIYRINNKLNKRFFYDVKGNNKDVFASTIYNGFRESYLASDYLETKIRNIFYYLISKHMNASTDMGDKYINTLKDIINELTFIYDDKLIDLNIKINYESELMNEENKKNFILKYLLDYAKNIMCKMVVLNDEYLEEDNHFAEAMSLQVLLRSIFLIINDYNILAYLDDVYNELRIDSNTAVNGIIKTAFISNYHDYNEYKKIKEI